MENTKIKAIKIDNVTINGKKRDDIYMHPDYPNYYFTPLGEYYKIDKLNKNTNYSYRQYKRIIIKNKNGDYDNVPLHRIIAEMFVPLPARFKNDYTGIVVDHINGNKRDNRASNLQWLYFKENSIKRHLSNNDYLIDYIKFPCLPRSKKFNYYINPHAEQFGKNNIFFHPLYPNIGLCKINCQNTYYLWDKNENTLIIKNKFTIGNYKYISFNGKKIRLHLVIALLFVKPPEGYEDDFWLRFVVNHKNGNKHDNNPENLEWVTQTYNAQHASNMGLCDCRLKPLICINKETESLHRFKSAYDASRALGLTVYSINNYLLKNRKGYVNDKFIFMYDNILINNEKTFIKERIDKSNQNTNPNYKGRAIYVINKENNDIKIYQKIAYAAKDIGIKVNRLLTYLFRKKLTYLFNKFILGYIDNDFLEIKDKEKFINDKIKEVNLVSKKKNILVIDKETKKYHLFDNYKDISTNLV